MDRNSRVLERYRGRQASSSSIQAPEIQSGTPTALDMGTPGAQRDGTTLEQQGVQMGQGARRLAQSGPAKQYREDYGFKMTDDQYKDYKGKDEKWMKDLSSHQSTLGGYQTKINTARESLDREKAEKEKEIEAAAKRLAEAKGTTLDSLYSKAQQGWTSVKVINPDNQVEGTYKMPRAAAEELARNIGESRWFNFAGNDMYVTTAVKKSAGGGNRGGELHQMLGTSQNDIKAAFFEKSMPQYQKLKEEVASGYSKLNSARQQLIDSYNSQLSELYNNETMVKSQMQQVNMAKKEHYDTLNKYKSEYEAKLAKRKALLGA